MTLGQKIKKLRTERKMTQAVLSDDLITRNMLSQIENDVALPSLPTLIELARRLGVSPGHLLAETDDDPVPYKDEKMPRILRLFKDKKYEECAEEIRTIFGDRGDDEIWLVYAEACLCAAQNALASGAMTTADRYCGEVLTASEQTVFDTRALKARALLLSAAAKNPQSPRLELSEDDYLRYTVELSGEELYRYLCDDSAYAYRAEQLAVHAKARHLMQEQRFRDAYNLLEEYVTRESAAQIGAFVLFRIYGDMETCARNTRDFENAYRMSVKRLSMLSAFRT